MGCGTVEPEGDRACSCYYLEHGDVRALLDCGPGAVQALARLGLDWAGLTHLFITHFHADHVGALPGLFFALSHAIHPARTEAPLRVVGPVGTRSLFRDLSHALGDYLLDPGFPLHLEEILPGRERAYGPLTVTAHDVPHTPESVAFRFDADEVRLVYTGDTGPDEELAAFARGADLLLAECSLPDDLVGDNHLSPARLARLAGRANAARLVVTHVYPQFRAAADVVDLIARAGYGGPIEAASEGLEVRL